jgi:hypothetical protein
MRFHGKPNERTHGGEQFTVVSISHGDQEAVLERHSDRTRIRMSIHELTREIICGRARLLDQGNKSRR